MVNECVIITLDLVFLCFFFRSNVQLTWNSKTHFLLTPKQMDSQGYFISHDVSVDSPVLKCSPRKPKTGTCSRTNNKNKRNFLKLTSVAFKPLSVSTHPQSEVNSDINRWQQCVGHLTSVASHCSSTLHIYIMPTVECNDKWDIKLHEHSSFYPINTCPYYNRALYTVHKI